MSAISGNSGEVLWGSAVNISGITAASSAVISVAATTSFSTGDRVYIESVSGMTEINSLHGTITSISAGVSITVDINSTAFSAYTSGGTVTHVIDVTKFSYTQKGNVSNVTDSSSTSEEFVATGYTNTSGSFEGFLKSGVNQPTFHSEIAFKFYLSSTAYFSGNGIITDSGASLEINGTNAVALTFSFQGTGDYTLTNP